MNLDQVRKILREECESAGSQAAWAFRHSVSPAYVSDTLNGRREPGPALLAALGIKRVTSYEWEK